MCIAASATPGASDSFSIPVQASEQCRRIAYVGGTVAAAGTAAIRHVLEFLARETPECHGDEQHRPCCCHANGTDGLHCHLLQEVTWHRYTDVASTCFRR